MCEKKIFNLKRSTSAAVLEERKRQLHYVEVWNDWEAEPRDAGGKETVRVFAGPSKPANQKPKPTACNSLKAELHKSTPETAGAVSAAVGKREKAICKSIEERERVFACMHTDLDWLQELKEKWKDLKAKK